MRRKTVEKLSCLSVSTRRRGRRRNKLLDDLGDRRGYSHLKEEALDRIKWRNRFGRGCGLVVRQITDDDDDDDDVLGGTSGPEAFILVGFS
jgi:hypothetical protein